MKKHLENNLKAERRDIRKRPRMKISGASLKKRNKFSALKAAKKR